MNRVDGSRTGLRRRAGPAALMTLLGLAVAVPGLHAQSDSYRIPAPADTALSFPRDTVLAMLARTRALYDTLQEDPEIVYYVGYGPEVPARDPGQAYPWNAVTVRSDSAVRVVTPANLREADRAYYNYAVARMRERSRARGDEGCRGVVGREVAILSAYVDGWIVARTLYGAPPYPPLDELAFARDAGYLPAVLVAHGASELGTCDLEWQTENPGGLDAYRRWRERVFLGQTTAAEPSAAPEPGGTGPASGKADPGPGRRGTGAARPSRPGAAAPGP